MRTLITLGILGTLLPFQVRSEEPTAGKQVEQALEISASNTIPYLIYLPKDYSAAERKWPLVLFLHGRGESGKPLSALKTWGLPHLLGRGDQLPFLVVSPQCPPEPETWSKTNQQALLMELLDHTIQNYRVDTNRIYLTGASMGGTGSWRLAAAYPERFAAVVPISGTGKLEEADKLKDIPLWAWAGVLDRAVPVQHSIDMVEAIRKAGGTNARVTTLEGIGHDAWDAAYASPDFYRWLLKQTRAKTRPGTPGSHAPSSAQK